MAPFKGNIVTSQQKLWNQRMNTVRVSVEWVFARVFGGIVNYY